MSAEQDENTRREEIYKRLRDRQKSDLKRVLDRAEGRRFIWRVLSEGRVFGSCYSNNALDMARMEGKRDNALWLLNEIMKVGPDIFTQMQKESVSDKLQVEAEINKGK